MKDPRESDYVGAPYSEPDTSKAAAEQILDDLGRLQALVYRCIRRRGEDGRTSDELSEQLGLIAQTVTPRVWELRLAGLIIDSGKRRPTRRGRMAKVWVVAQRQLGLGL
jgi:predicted ArsR family transcriptional regulator